MTADTDHLEDRSSKDAASDVVSLVGIGRSVWIGQGSELVTLPENAIHKCGRAEPFHLFHLIDADQPIVSRIAEFCQGASRFLKGLHTRFA